MKKILPLLTVFLLSALVAWPLTAHALPILSLSDNWGNVVVIPDGGGLDSNPLVGAVTYVGPVGTGPFVVNVTTGLTKPLLGNPLQAQMDLNSVDVSAGIGTLTIMFSETAFSGGLPFIPNSKADMAIGGTTGGTVTYQAYFDNNNNPFGLTTLIGTLGPFGGPAFAGVATANITTNALYSLTQVVTIFHPGITSSSFNATLDVTPVPEPATIMLLATGLAGVVLARRSPKTE